MKSVKEVDLVFPTLRDFIICTRFYSTKYTTTTKNNFLVILSHYIFLDKADFSTLIDPINAFLCNFGIKAFSSFSSSSKTYKYLVREVVISPVAPSTIGIMLYM